MPSNNSSVRLTSNWHHAAKFTSHDARWDAIDHVRRHHGLEAFPLFAGVKVDIGGMTLWVEKIEPVLMPEGVE